MLHRNVREAIERGPSLIAELSLNGSGGFFRSPHAVREDLTYATPTDTYPAALRIDRPNSHPAKIVLPTSLVSELSSWFGEWQQDAAIPASGPARDLWIALSDLDCFGPPRKPATLQGVATFVGHATVLLSGQRTKPLRHNSLPF